MKTRQELLDDNYRRVEAMYRRGLSIDEICRSSYLTRMDVLDIVQKIFATDQRKAARV